MYRNGIIVRAYSMSFNKAVSPQIRLLLLLIVSLSTTVCRGFYANHFPNLQANMKSLTSRKNMFLFNVQQSIIKDDDDYEYRDAPTESVLLNDEHTCTVTNRRWVISSLLMSIGLAVGGDASNNIAQARTPETSLKWEASPINKRSGVTVFQAEKGGYNIRFVTYLSRFLLSFDPECQRWWYTRAGTFNIFKCQDSGCDSFPN